VIRGNLATRPFYNERRVHVWLAAAAVLVVGLTIFNVSRVLKYSRADTELATQAARDEARAADLRRQAAQLRASVDPRQLEHASVEARQANDLIDRRTFSWTELLNRFETTLPDDVRITSVRPHVDRRTGTTIEITVVARTTDDVNKFMENLVNTGAFTNVRPIEEHPNDQGQLEASLDAGYQSPGGETPPAKPQRGGAPPR
jgi:Tfp pilus assembly protein PilN